MYRRINPTNTSEEVLLELGKLDVFYQCRTERERMMDWSVCVEDDWLK